MEEARENAVAACDGCHREAFVLHAVDGARLCDGCSEKSARIDRQLEHVRSDDPVLCDGCGDLVAFDARVAVVARECGGVVLCDDCKPIAIESAIESRRRLEDPS